MNQIISNATASTRTQTNTATFHIQPLQQWQTEANLSGNLPTRQNSYTIIYCAKGQLSCIIDLKEYSLEHNTLCYVKPGQVLQLQDHNAEGFILMFSPQFLNGNQEQENPLPIPFSTIGFIMGIRESDSNEMNCLLEKICYEFIHATIAREEILKSLLKLYLRQLQSQTIKAELSGRINAGNAYIVKRFMTLLENNYVRWKMVADYAQELSITANYLNEIIKKVTGFSARYHIQQRVITEAKRKAVYARMSMKEVAYNLGFDDIYHFSKYFKKISGSNFTEFKRSHLGAVA
jgi:AraC family transcriptional regulator, transcriptional activator of pobA